MHFFLLLLQPNGSAILSFAIPKFLVFLKSCDFVKKGEYLITAGYPVLTVHIPDAYTMPQSLSPNVSRTSKHPPSS
jgi:hypothetical protein